MEFTEVVTPSVAVPVLCVLVCAFLVFAFGFKSPAQPPSFDVFDEDGKKKRLKKSKSSKSQSNGHAVIDGDSHGHSAKPQPSPRQSGKQASKSQSPVPNKSQSPAPAKTKPANQNQEQSKKAKKQTAKEEEMKLKQREAEKRKEEMLNDTDGWHTISKKDKKQKKKESERQEPVQEETEVKEEVIQKPKSDEMIQKAKTDEPIEPVEQATPMEQRNKKKKEKKTKKTKEEEMKEEELNVDVKEKEKETIPEPIVEDSPSVVEIEIKVSQTNESCLKKTNHWNKIRSNTNQAVQPQEMDAMETTVDEVQNSKSSNNKTSKQEGKKDSKKESKKDSPPPDDFVIPKSALEPEVEVSSISPSSIKPDISDTTSKSPKKKKRDKSKRKEEKMEADSSVPEDSQTGASGSLETSHSDVTLSTSLPPKTSTSEVQSPVTEEPKVVPESNGAEAAAPAQSASFDEMGEVTESWTEAKPKSKKKKARRAD